MAEKSVVKRLQEQVERLIADHERISRECRDLVSQRDKALTEKRRLEEKVKEQEARIRALELTGVMRGSADSIERARARVNSLLREIDRCIAIVSSEQSNDK